MNMADDDGHDAAEDDVGRQHGSREVDGACQARDRRRPDGCRTDSRPTYVAVAVASATGTSVRTLTSCMQDFDGEEHPADRRVERGGDASAAAGRDERRELPARSARQSAKPMTRMPHQSG